jgi:hypothetical protein
MATRGQALDQAQCTDQQWFLYGHFLSLRDHRRFLGHAATARRRGNPHACSICTLRPALGLDANGDTLDTRAVGGEAEGDFAGFRADMQQVMTGETVEDAHRLDLLPGQLT